MKTKYCPTCQLSERVKRDRVTCASCGGDLLNEHPTNANCDQIVHTGTGSTTCSRPFNHEGPCSNLAVMGLARDCTAQGCQARNLITERDIAQHGWDRDAEDKKRLIGQVEDLRTCAAVYQAAVDELKFRIHQLEREVLVGHEFAQKYLQAETLLAALRTDLKDPQKLS